MQAEHRPASGQETSVPRALPDISRETLLELAPNIRTRFDGAGHVLVDAPDGTIVDIGPRGYSILSLFSRPVALGDAIEQLDGGERSATDFVPTLSVINMLIEEGALVRPDARRRSVERMGRPGGACPHAPRRSSDE